MKPTCRQVFIEDDHKKTNIYRFYNTHIKQETGSEYDRNLSIGYLLATDQFKTLETGSISGLRNKFINVILEISWRARTFKKYSSFKETEASYWL